MSFKPGRRMARRFARRSLVNATWQRKTRGVYGWRSAHGQRASAEGMGGRLSVAHAHAQKGGPGRKARARYVAARRKAIESGR